MQRYKGKISAFRPLNNYEAQVELEGIAQVFHLSIGVPWVLNLGDEIILIGSYTAHSGQVVSNAYKNLSKNVKGSLLVFSVGWGELFFICLLFFWTIFFPIARFRECMKVRKHNSVVRQLHELLNNDSAPTITA
ncbi:hypothetical protein [Comamonas sp.]|uniref:hypothetical protein n=1 Tax=Comamonas sp. TaxID=34028 RepID=UPI002587BB15|nr:hypothetical protein [Comamonas sp.]